MNNPRADHRVSVMSFGTCVKIPYLGYEISLGADGSTTCVYGDESGEPLFIYDGTDGQAVKDAINAIEFLAVGD